MGKAWTSLPPASLGRPWPAAQIVRLPFLRFWAPGPSRPLQSHSPALCECSPSTLGCSPGRCLGPGERPAQTALFWAILSQPPPPFRFRRPVWPAAEAAAGAGQGGRAGVGAPARPFPSAGPPRGLGQLKPQEEEARNQELAGAVWGLSVSRSSEAQEQLPASVMPILRPRRQRPTQEAVGQGPGRRSERGTRDRVEQGPWEGRGWGWGWRVAAWGACRGSLGPAEGPMHILHLQRELGGKIQGRRLWEVSVPGLGRRPPASGLHLGHGKHRRLSQARRCFVPIVAFQGGRRPPSACLWLFSLLPPCPAPPSISSYSLSVVASPLSVPRTTLWASLQSCAAPRATGPCSRCRRPSSGCWRA